MTTHKSAWDFSPETATGEMLDRLGEAYGTWDREYYGDDYENCPNDHCFWTYEGWVETDSHLRARILQRGEKI